MSNATAKRTATRLIKKALVEGAPKGSKKAAALAVYAAAEGERKVGVDRLVKDLNMTPGTASTYWQNIRAGVWSS